MVPVEAQKAVERMSAGKRKAEEIFWQQLLPADDPEHANLTLQSRLRMNLIQAVLDGRIAGGTRLPSTRSLAAILQVARVTVALAYEELSLQGYLVVQKRSGHFVAEGLESKQAVRDVVYNRSVRPPAWSSHLVSLPEGERWLEKPRSWQKYRYPFVYGQMDTNLFPIAAWRDCSRLAQATAQSVSWASDAIDRDNAFLVEQLCNRVLPRRGIKATPDQVLLTMGSQMGAYLLSELLVRRGSTVALEDPGYMDGRNIFLRRGAKILPMPVDEDGVVPPNTLSKFSCVYCTPSHQCPTGATLSIERRLQFLKLAQQHKSILIEDDYDAETQFTGSSLPSLKAMDNSGHVIYLSSLSKFFAPGLRMGYIVADPTVIERARHLRRLILRHTPGNNQRALALFIAHGHYERLLARHRESLRERSAVLIEALRRYLPEWQFTEPTGGSALWVQAPADCDMASVELHARKKGILLESGRAFFHASEPPQNFARLAYSTIPLELIEPGIRALRQVVRKRAGSI